MNIVNLEPSRLADYVRAQIVAVAPTGHDPELGLIDTHLPEALARLERCLASIRMWRAGEFDVLHSSQHCTFVYYLANTIWVHEHARSVCTKLFLLNKAHHAIDCFYEIVLPEVFFIGHSPGIVLAKATYGNRLAIYQGVTVGRNGDASPVIEDNVILYPGSAAIGACRIARGSVLSQGTRLTDRDTEAGMIAFTGAGGVPVFRRPGRDLWGDFFRD